MKLFKSVDEKFADLGFCVCEPENEYGINYARYNETYDYTQKIDIGRKRSGKHLIQSYVSGVNSDGFNDCAGMTEKEMRLALKKLRQMKRKYRWE